MMATCRSAVPWLGVLDGGFESLLALIGVGLFQNADQTERAIGHGRLFLQQSATPCSSVGLLRKLAIKASIHRR